jgi:hypothetical protein
MLFLEMIGRKFVELWTNYLEHYSVLYCHIEIKFNESRGRQIPNMSERWALESISIDAASRFSVYIRI